MNNTTEQLVIGAVLLDGQFADIDVSYFENAEHQQIWQTITELKNLRRPIDMATVSIQMHKKGLKIDPKYLAEIQNDVPVASHKHRYIQMLVEAKVRRELRDMTKKIEEELTMGIDEKKIISNMIAKVKSLTVGKTGSNICDIWDRYEEERFKKGSTVFGNRLLDYSIKGLRDGTFGIIAAYSGTGKTMIAMQMAVNFAKQSKKIGVYSLEMKDTDIFERVERILKHKKESIDEIMQWDFMVNDNVRDWYSIEVDAQKNDRQIIFVDFAQIVKTEGRIEYERMQNLARQIQSFCKETNITVFLLSQISNDTAKNDTGIVNAKGGGDLFAACDVFIDIRRDFKAEVEQKSNKNTPGFAGNKNTYTRSLHVSKNRFGMEAGADIEFDPSYGVGLYSGF